MRKVLQFALLFLFFVSGNMLGAAEKWLPGPDSRWHIKLETALAQAQKKNKFVYVLNTGSDWCGFCKVLLKNVLSTELFAELAEKHLELVYLDSPSKKVPMPTEQRRYNMQTSQKLRFGGGVPSAIILNQKGEIVGRIHGYRALPLYISELYKILNVPGCPEFPAEAKVKLQKRNGSGAVEVGVKLTHWGTSQNAVNKPLNAADLVEVAPGKKVFFKVEYSLPRNLKAELVLKDWEDQQYRFLRGKVYRRGTYVFSAVAPHRDGYWGVRGFTFKAVVLPNNREYRKASFSIPCGIAVKPALLNAEEMVRFTEKADRLKADFSKARIEIIGWGSDRKCENKYTPGQAISSTTRNVYLKLRYRMPGAASIGINSHQNPYVDFTVMPDAGTFVTTVFVRRPISQLYVSLRPVHGELLRNIITIPCNITTK